MLRVLLGTAIALMFIVCVVIGGAIALQLSSSAPTQPISDVATTTPTPHMQTTAERKAALVQLYAQATTTSGETQTRERELANLKTSASGTTTQSTDERLQALKKLSQ